MNNLSDIGELLRTQDNRCTDQPMFIVERKARDFGYDAEYGDGFMWVNEDDPERMIDPENDEELEGLSWGEDDEDGDDHPAGWYRCYYKDRWEFVTACFTEQGCKDYLKTNGHNLHGETSIYADGSFRNEEYQRVRRALMEICRPEPTTSNQNQGDHR